jgi:predicted metal-binding membrane protein
VSSTSSTEARVAAGLVAALAVAAWAALALWAASPGAAYLSHDELVHVDPGEAGLLAAFVAGWTLMIAAMMLPTSLPLVSTFAAMTARHDRSRALVTRLVAGYVAVWTAVGAALHAGDLALHELAHATGWIEPLVLPGTLALAGAYELSELKRSCLTKCRSPRFFVAERWHGRDPRREALRLGVAHGAFCVGCCWSLMLVMFAVGAGNLAAMLALGALMAVEKNLSWGRRLSTPVGVGLLVAAAIAALA